MSGAAGPQARSPSLARGRAITAAGTPVSRRREHTRLAVHENRDTLRDSHDAIDLARGRPRGSVGSRSQAARQSARPEARPYPHGARLHALLPIEAAVERQMGPTCSVPGRCLLTVITTANPEDDEGRQGSRQQSQGCGHRTLHAD